MTQLRLPGGVLRRLDYVCLQPTREGQASYAHVNEIVAGLRRRGWEVRLIQPSHPRSGPLDGLRRAVAAATTQLRYFARCRFRPAPFVYVRGHFAALPTAILARVAGAVVVQEFNGPLEDALDAWPGLRPLRGPLSIVTRAQIRWADTVVVVTEGLRLHWRDRSGRQAGYQVIGNGANVEQFRPASSAGPPGSRPSVVFVGALAPWQGIDTVLAATEALGWPSGVDLVIAGDGMERHKVEAAATSNPRIRWLGAIPYSQAASVVAGSLAAVVPVADVPRSRYGLSPLKLFEAMACGVPVVASNLPGLGDIVRAHDCGLTFPAGDPNALARSVAELAADPARAREMGSRGRDAAVAYYSWDARAGQTEEVLLLAAARRRAGGRSTRHGRSAS